MKKKSFKKGTADMITSLVGGAIAGVAAVAVDKYVLKNTDPLYSGVGMVAAGAVLPMFVSVKGSAEAGAGLIAVGAERIAKKYMPSGTTAVSGLQFNRPRFKFIGNSQSRATEFLSEPMSTIGGSKKKAEMGIVE